MLLNNLFLYSPFEQFDAVTWVLMDYLLESKAHLDEYMFYSMTPEVSGLISQEKNVNFRFIMGSFYIFVALINILSMHKETFNNYIVSFKQDFSFIFFFVFFYFVTGGLLTIWFADVSVDFSAEDGFYDYPTFLFIGEYFMDSIIFPQINLALLLDENLISFFVAFFLFSGSEENEDEDFILEEEESDFIGDIVAPLFISNLGKDVEDNGALFLKVSGIFGFILLNNLMGMLPYSDTGTSSLLLTFWVALSVFVSLLTLMITKHGVNYLFSLFLPHGTPFPIIFLLIPIEFISYTFRLLSLSVRLFANMMAGHVLLKVIVGFSWTMILMGDFFLVANIFPIGILFVLIFLEIGVALIQSYVFTILTCMYLKDIFVGH
jgi:ATP synthase subunit 6